MLELEKMFPKHHPQKASAARTRDGAQCANNAKLE